MRPYAFIQIELDAHPNCAVDTQCTRAQSLIVYKWYDINKGYEMKLKRAPGGGRKPKIERTAPLSVRMPTEMRERLEATAKAKGKKLSRELLWRMSESLNRDREQDRDPAMRALCFLIATLGEQITGGSYTADKSMRDKQIKEWRTDPFLFKAFKFAVIKLLDALEPPGEVRPPIAEKEIKKFTNDPRKIKYLMMRIKSPKNFSAQEVSMVLMWLNSDYSMLDVHNLRLRHRVPAVASRVKNELYGYIDARRDLELKPKGRKS